ncbi:MAG: hypothetical protein CMO59_14335 [Verrucomicrobiales bacterium]|nr:hypothetical protein [Verrucomicrobiales bacterium]
MEFLVLLILIAICVAIHKLSKVFSQSNEAIFRSNEALNRSNEALAEIEVLKEKLFKLHQTQIDSLTQGKALEEIEALKSTISKLSIEQRKTQTNKTVDMRTVSQEKSQPVKIEKSTSTPPPIPKNTIEENLVEGTIWTEHHSYEEGNTITTNYVLRHKDKKSLSAEYSKARLTLIRKNYVENDQEREEIISKLVNVFQGQVRSESFKAMEEGQYQLILNYGPLGKQTAESETFTIIKRKVSKPVLATPSPKPIEKKTAISSKTENPMQPGEMASRVKDIEQPESLEIKLGTYWFVRIGVLLLLTGLGSLAWFNKDFFLELSKGTKITLFYILSFGMGGLGLWLHRRKKELQNFGQVLIAGSFAGTYFTTYAAHIFPPVKIIESSALVLILLFLLGVLMIGAAEKLKSQTIALFAIGSSYYATYVPLIHQGTISPWIILASNLILAIASVVFMVRNQWFRIPAMSMGASYLGFFIWRFLEKNPDFILVTLFLGSLWFVYTVAVFICKHKEFSDNHRATFLTINNASLFGFMTWEMFKSSETNFWILGLSIGLILIACAFIASKFLNKHPLTKNAYLVQGLSLATLGLMTTKQSESIKGSILAAETLVLLFSSSRLKSILVRYASVVVSIASLTFGFISIYNNNGDYFMSSLTITGFLLACGILSAKKIENENKILLRQFTSYFTGAAILIFTGAVLYQLNNFENSVITSPLYNLLILSSIPIIVCISHYFLRIRELTLLGQIPFAFVAVFSLDFIANQESIFQIISILVLTLCLIHWWKIQGHLILNPDDHNTRLLKIPSIIEACYSVVIVAQIFSWSISTTFDSSSNNEVWLWLGPLLAMALMIYSIVAKLKYLGALSQLFLGFACLIQIETCLGGHKENPLLALIPMATIMVTLFLIKVGSHKFSSLKEQLKKYLLTIQTCYSILFTLLVILWVLNYCPDEYRSLVSMILTVTCFQVGNKIFTSHKNLAQYLSLSYLVTGFLYLAGELSDNNASILSLVGILGLISFQQVSKSFQKLNSQSYKVQNSIVISTCIAIFAWCTVKSLETPEAYRALANLTLSVACLLISTKSFIVHNKQFYYLSISFLVAGFFHLFGELANKGNEVSLYSLLGILGLMFFQQVSKSSVNSFTKSTIAHNAIIISVSIALFAWCTVKVSDLGAGLRLITWAGLAVIYFLAGISLKERWYRLIGLLILGVSLLSLVPIIWDMSTTVKIASLFVLGAVFVGLGYIYTRYKDHIKKLL